jgi:Gpi18-like mannosyltransferase/predicted membrane-bound dolichyl-phosphate-mannose-protein mannosyltransferase
LRSAVRRPAVPLESTTRGLSQSSLALVGLLLIALVVRMLFIGAAGFPNDVSAFEAWALTLAEHPTTEFYAKAGFADYPPGYFYVLWICGHLYRTLVHSDPSYSALKFIVKLPGILFDIVDTALIYAIVRRYASTAWSFAAAALFAFNPAIVYISAYWGQVDSVPGAFTLGSLYLLLGADRLAGRNRDLSVVAAWLLLACSVLMKPPAIVLAPLFVAWIFMTDDATVRLRRAAYTGIGIAGGLVLAYLSTIPFHLGANPVAQFAWLYERYRFAAGVYAYNSVNAFNLYVMAPSNHFWMSDGTILPNWTIGGRSFGFPMYAWGIGLFVAAVALVVSRLVQRRDSIALLEAAMVLSLGYFVLSTRMHERYIYNAVMLAIPLAFYRRRYLYAAIAISITLLANLIYSFDYVGMMSAPAPGVDTTDLMPFVSRPGAFLNVAAFFYLGYVFLGSGSDVLETFGRRKPTTASGASVRSSFHRWFAPLEGSAWMLPRDWAIAGFLTVASFVSSFIDYTWPAEKIFDEIYYARAGEEYLQHKEIFEFTHPPLTKLWVTLSMMLFGGMHGLGDTSAGWRFLNLVMGALMVLVLYCFAKRLLGSTAFATIAASLLLFDGFHYVQSRIATPEITVAFFALLTLYAFYRFWIASQVRVAPILETSALRMHAIFFGCGLVVAAAFSAFVAQGQDATTHAIAFLYAATGVYIAVRFLVPRFATKPPELVSYAEGSFFTRGTLVTPDGGRVPAQGAIVAGDGTVAGKNDLVAVDVGLRIEYARSGAMRYATDAGNADFFPDGRMVAGEATTDGRKDGAMWLWILAVCSGCLASSKWNGLFDFFVIWVLAAVVVLQWSLAPIRRAIGMPNTIARAATLGNPLGFSFDLVVAVMMFVGASIYVLCYIPYFRLNHNLSDLIGLQQQMFGYHYDLKATHPYGSKWWQWPLILRPISYYYHDFRIGADLQNAAACCVAEIIAIPNPAVWWGGLVSIPFVGWLGFRERNKGYLLLLTAYLFQWLPWAASPRVAFEYHFFPNLAIICLANAVLLQRAWQYGARYATEGARDLFARYGAMRLAVVAYLALVVGLAVFFYPIWAGLHVRWNVWDARMWHWLMGNQWV